MSAFDRLNPLHKERLKAESCVPLPQCVVVAAECINYVVAVDEHESTCVDLELGELRLVGCQFLFECHTWSVPAQARRVYTKYIGRSGGRVWAVGTFDRSRV